MSEQPPRWALLDLKYEYLDDGFKLIAITDVPCHLFCRMTTTEPLTHPIPVMRRGTLWRTDVRFCFVVYEDNEQEEPGDTLTHTFEKSSWPICQYRWFYFWGTISGLVSPSETAIFKFHFPAPPPAPPPPLLRVFYPQANNRTIMSNSVTWPGCWAGSSLFIPPNWDAPYYLIIGGVEHVATFYAYRGFLTFDTSPIPLTAKIVSAALKLWDYEDKHTSSTAYPYLQATKGHQSDPVVINDWYAQNAEILVLGQVDLRDLILNTRNTIPLNTTGIAHITPGGLTKYCIRGQQDVGNIFPPLGTNWCLFHSLQKGGEYRPRLEVTYYPA